MRVTANTLRVDGAPTQADFQTFFKELDNALVATRNDASKWNDFAKAVLKNACDTPTNRAILARNFDRLLDHRKRVRSLNADSSRYGYARLDAVGYARDPQSV